MTRLVISIDEATLERLSDKAALGNHPLEQEAAQRLRMAVHDLPDAPVRVLLLHGEPLDTLETILGGGSLLNANDLLKKVRRLAGISFLHVRLPFTPNQLEALQEKAARQGLTVDQLVDRTAPRIYEHFFDLIERSH